ncbi:MAG TPA: DUF547 domain-containing protein [Alphaproteobacteria bacterium]|nr:DUF547 domain-containing protein [Alphaproteobacteria bacterium]
MATRPTAGIRGALRRLAPALIAPALLALHLLAAPAAAAPAAEPWPRWQAEDPASALTVDHSAWSRFLAAYRVVGPDGIARLRYAAVAPADRAALDAYLAGLAAQPVSRLRRAEQRALWMNLYNALTVKTVLDRMPVASIRDIDISPGLFADGPWGAKLVVVEGEPLSLDDIEHRILRPIWRDPRTHYGVNCASLGCPDLPAEAFTAANLETLLDSAARAYVNHPRGAAVEGGRLVVSSIYDWFEADFGGSPAGVIAHLRQHAGPGLRAALEGVAGIADDRYDWALNGAP